MSPQPRRNTPLIWPSSIFREVGSGADISAKLNEGINDLLRLLKCVTASAVHKDPFDRLLVAQAWYEPMILSTDDDVLGGYGTFVEAV